MAETNPAQRAGPGKKQTGRHEKRSWKARKVSELMRSKTVACDEDTPVIEVAQIMVVHRIRYCLVLDGHNELKGIVIARTLQKAAGAGMEQKRARDVMLPEIIMISQDATIGQAAAEMFRNRVQHLVVVSDRPGSHAALGIIGATDILRYVSFFGRRGD